MTRFQFLESTFFLVSLSFCIAATGQACHFSEADADAEVLRAAPTCQAAYKQYNDCLWGSSADGLRGGFVRDKCEPLFLAKLTPDQKTIYNDKLQFCAQQYEFAGGTLAISESNTCAVRIIFDFATDVAKASKPLPFASFDCSLARSPIEKAICSHSQLGRADLLVSTAYKPFFNAVQGADRTKLIANQRAWNANTPIACHFKTAPEAQATISCLVEAYKKRAGLLNECANGPEVDGCLHAYENPGPQGKAN